MLSSIIFSARILLHLHLAHRPSLPHTTFTLAVQYPPSSTNGDSIKKGKKGKGKDKEEQKKAGKGSNLVGKFTNLVSTNLNNTVGGEGRGFLMLLTSLTRQITLRIAFLCKVFGWNPIVGTVTALSLCPHWQNGSPPNHKTSRQRR